LISVIHVVLGVVFFLW